MVAPRGGFAYGAANLTKRVAQGKQKGGESDRKGKNRGGKLAKKIKGTLRGYTRQKHKKSVSKYSTGQKEAREEKNRSYGSTG